VAVVVVVIVPTLVTAVSATNVTVNVTAVEFVIGVEFEVVEIEIEDWVVFVIVEMSPV
jgi:hypothetical protein